MSKLFDAHHRAALEVMGGGGTAADAAREVGCREMTIKNWLSRVLDKSGCLAAAGVWGHRDLGRAKATWASWRQRRALARELKLRRRGLFSRVDQAMAW